MFLSRFNWSQLNSAFPEKNLLQVRLTFLFNLKKESMESVAARRTRKPRTTSLEKVVMKTRLNSTVRYSLPCLKRCQVELPDFLMDFQWRLWLPEEVENHGRLRLKK